MKGLESLIESEAFLPILIILLVVLVSVFVWVISSNKKEERMRRERKRQTFFDENAEIKIIVNEEQKNIAKEDEIKIVEEKENDKLDDVILDEEDKYAKELISFNKEYQELSIFEPKEEEKIELPSFKQKINTIKKETIKEDLEALKAFSLDGLTEDNLLTDEEVEDKIIKSANEYIASIMKKDEENR